VVTMFAFMLCLLKEVDWRSVEKDEFEVKVCVKNMCV